MDCINFPITLTETVDECHKALVAECQTLKSFGTKLIVRLCAIIKPYLSKSDLGDEVDKLVKFFLNLLLEFVEDNTIKDPFNKSDFQTVMHVMSILFSKYILSAERDGRYPSHVLGTYIIIPSLKILSYFASFNPDQMISCWSLFFSESYKVGRAVEDQINLMTNGLSSLKYTGFNSSFALNFQSNGYFGASFTCSNVLIKILICELYSIDVKIASFKAIQSIICTPNLQKWLARVHASRNQKNESASNTLLRQTQLFLRIVCIFMFKELNVDMMEAVLSFIDSVLKVLPLSRIGSDTSIVSYEIHTLSESVLELIVAVIFKISVWRSLEIFNGPSTSDIRKVQLSPIALNLVFYLKNNLVVLSKLSAFNLALLSYEVSSIQDILGWSSYIHEYHHTPGEFPISDTMKEIITRGKNCSYLVMWCFLSLLAIRLRYDSKAKILSFTLELNKIYSGLLYKDEVLFKCIVNHLLKSEIPEEREFCCQLLGPIVKQSSDDSTSILNIKPSNEVKKLTILMLLSLMNDDYHMVRNRAVIALGQIGKNCSWLLGDYTSEADSLLGKIIISLNNLSSDETKQVRASALRALGDLISNCIGAGVIKSAISVRTLFKERCYDSNLAVRIQAYWSLSKYYMRVEVPQSKGEINNANEYNYKLLLEEVRLFMTGLNDSEKVHTSVLRGLGLIFVQLSEFYKYDIENLDQMFALHDEIHSKLCPFREIKLLIKAKSKDWICAFCQLVGYELYLFSSCSINTQNSARVNAVISELMLSLFDILFFGFLQVQILSAQFLHFFGYGFYLAYNTDNNCATSTIETILSSKALDNLLTLLESQGRSSIILSEGKSDLALEISRARAINFRRYLVVLITDFVTCFIKRKPRTSEDSVKEVMSFHIDEVVTVLERLVRHSKPFAIECIMDSFGIFKYLEVFRLIFPFGQSSSDDKSIASECALAICSYLDAWSDPQNLSKDNFVVQLNPVLFLRLQALILPNKELIFHFQTSRTYSIFAENLIERPASLMTEMIDLPIEEDEI